MHPKRFYFYSNARTLAALVKSVSTETQDFEVHAIEAPKTEADFDFFRSLWNSEKFKRLDLSRIKENVEIVARILSEAKPGSRPEIIGATAGEEATLSGAKRKYSELSSSSKVINSQAKPEAMLATAAPREKLKIIRNMRFKNGEFSRSIQITRPTVLTISSLVRAEDEPLLNALLKNPAWSKFILRIDCSQIKIRPSEIDPEPIFGAKKMTHDEWITDYILKARRGAKDQVDYLKILHDYFGESQARAKELVEESVMRIKRCCGARAPKILMPVAAKLIPICVLINGDEINIQWVGTEYDHSKRPFTLFPTVSSAPLRKIKPTAVTMASEVNAGAGCASAAFS